MSPVLAADATTGTLRATADWAIVFVCPCVARGKRA